MKEDPGPVIGVPCAGVVFVPTAFIPGITGGSISSCLQSPCRPRLLILGFNAHPLESRSFAAFACAAAGNTLGPFGTKKVLHLFNHIFAGPRWVWLCRGAALIISRSSRLAVSYWLLCCRQRSFSPKGILTFPPG